VRHASRGGAAWGWLGLDRPWPPRHSATLRLGAVACDATGAWLAWPCLSPSAPSTSLLQQPPTPTPPRAGPVVSSTPRCPSLTPTRPLAPPPRLVSSRLANRKACRRNNRQSPKQIGRGERRHARGGRGKKAEQREREVGREKEKKKKEIHRPQRRRALHTRSSLPPSERCRIQRSRPVSGWDGGTRDRSSAGDAATAPDGRGGGARAGGADGGGALGGCGAGAGQEEAEPSRDARSVSLSVCARPPRLLWCWWACVRATAAATTAPSAPARSDGLVARPPPPADPDAEVIALSPGTLLATNRFVCEVCGKGFQRDQNLQLHRRGHNLPWRLRQRGPGAAPPRRRVYVCPEPGCVHHSPTRALGDLTGIKKHFCRKHGEKRWACPRCGKRYAVQADLKAHAKTCGTREYRCDCGTLFTRCGDCLLAVCLLACFFFSSSSSSSPHRPIRGNKKRKLAFFLV
jgi:hypothetical protein